jgi:hypothetical protein
MPPPSLTWVRLATEMSSARSRVCQKQAGAGGESLLFGDQYEFAKVTKSAGIALTRRGPIESLSGTVLHFRDGLNDGLWRNGGPTFERAIEDKNKGDKHCHDKTLTAKCHRASN